MTLAEAPELVRGRPESRARRVRAAGRRAAAPDTVATAESALDARRLLRGARRRVAAGARRARRRGRDRAAARHALRAGARVEGRRGADRSDAALHSAMAATRRSSPIRGRAPLAPAGWDARLDLAFERDGARTVLAAAPARRSAAGAEVALPRGPRRLPGDHRASAGRHRRRRFAGDRTSTPVRGAHAQLTTPGAAKWYRSAGAARARRRRCASATGALVEWLPQETMLFDGARAAIALAIELAPAQRVHRLGRDVPRAHGVGRALRRRDACGSRSSSSATAGSSGASARRSTAVRARSNPVQSSAARPCLARWSSLACAGPRRAAGSVPRGRRCARARAR